jgi:hypothetical protein
MIEMEEFYPWWWLMRDSGAVVCWWVVWPVIDFTPHIDLLVGTHVVFIRYFSPCDDAELTVLGVLPDDCRMCQEFKILVWLWEQEVLWSL